MSEAEAEQEQVQETLPLGSSTGHNVPDVHLPFGLTRHSQGSEPARPFRLAPERMTRRPSRSAERATDREVGVVAAVWSEKAAAHRRGPSQSTVKHHLANARSKVGQATTAQLVWIFAPRLPEPSSADEAPGTMPDPRGASREGEPA